MSQISRNRDVIIFEKSQTFTVNIDDRMAAGGWRGGSCVQYTPPVGDEILVTYSDGLYGGFLLWGSDEVPDNYTSMTRNQLTYKFAVIGTGGWIIATTSFEQYTYASRTFGGPLVPITYNASDRLVLSLRGYWTKEDEWTLSGDPRAPNNYFLGYVVQAPTAALNNFMTIQVSI
jgi:hypothetical protein